MIVILFCYYTSTTAEATTSLPHTSILTLIYTSSVDTSQTIEVQSETVPSSQFILSSISTAVISTSLSSFTDDLASTRAAVVPPFSPSIQPQNTTTTSMPMGGLDSEARAGLAVATIIAAALVTVALVVAGIIAVIAWRKKRKNKKDKQ